jgi:hypothetical protein
MERLPSEVALTQTTQAFTRIRREPLPERAGVKKLSKGGKS